MKTDYATGGMLYLYLNHLLISNARIVNMYYIW
jgi:hypothetical protein